MHAPTEHDAAAIVQAVLHEPAQTVRRFPTGLQHYVYDVVTASRAAVVVRIAHAAADALAGAVYWSQRLRPLGLPLPRLLHAELEPRVGRFPFLLLERLPGADLGLVYSELSPTQKRAVVAEVVRAQELVGSLPLGHGYGYADSSEAALPHRRWTGVLRASLARSRTRIRQAGVVDDAVVGRVEAILPRFARYLDNVRPRAFLDDTTTKNVLVHDGCLSGIVDVDVVCFGDPVWTIGLTHTALLSAGHDADYVEMWCELAALTAAQRSALALYTAVFCVDFMGEVGQVFNQGFAAEIDRGHAQRLGGIFDGWMRVLER